MGTVPQLEFDKTLTPENQWDKVKNKLFVGDVPDDFDKLVHLGFIQSTSSSEKWQRLAYVLSLFKEMAQRK